MAASNLLYSCRVFKVNRVYMKFSAGKTLYLYYQLQKKMLAGQDMWCREEYFLVFMYALRSIVRPQSGLQNYRDQNHAHDYFFIFPWLALYVALVNLIHRWLMLEKMRKTLSCGNSGRHKDFGGQRLRMRKAGSCKAPILETRAHFLETRSELFQNKCAPQFYFKIGQCRLRENYW